MNKPHKNIYVNDVIYEKLSTLRHPGQSFNGLFEEMLKLVDLNELRRKVLVEQDK